MSQIPEYEREVELIDYLEVMLKRKGLIAGITILCGLAVGIQTLLSSRSYEAQALVVVSQPIASARTTQESGPGGMPGTEIQVSGMAAPTYEALAKGDELIASLRDSLLATELPEDAKMAMADLTIQAITTGMLVAELVKETEDAESPLLAFRATSTVESLPTPLVNRWTELFMERHRGLSSNVADDYYQWVQGQYENSKGQLERTENDLRELTTSYSELSILQAEVGSKTKRLDNSLIEFQELETELESKSRELDYSRQQLDIVELEDEWIGYAELDQLPALRQINGAPRMRRELINLRYSLDKAVQDSLAMHERHDTRFRAQEADRRSRLLAFERTTSIERFRRRASELDSTLTAYREEAAQLDQTIKALGLDLEVRAKNLALESPVITTAKAIVDAELWDRVLEGRDVDERLQQALGKYRLVSETPNPVYEKLRDQLRQMRILSDRATTRIGFLEKEIPILEADLENVQVELDALVERESALLNVLVRAQIALQDSLARDALPLNESLALLRVSHAAQRAEYLQLQTQEDDLSRAVTRLGAQVEFRKESFVQWSDQIRAQGILADSLARVKRGLERETAVYQTTFDRFASLLEEARIARVQAAGDIQIVSRAVEPRPVARGTVKKAAIASIVGLMGSVMLAFLLEYVARARETGA